MPEEPQSAPPQPSLPEGPYPFDDPVQRTRCLVQYIRLRKQRAEDELAKRHALKKQKKDAKANLKNARVEFKSSESEVRRCEQRLEELGQTRHELLISLKSIINKETERKRHREQADETRRLEEQHRMQQAAAAAALGLDTLLLQQQFKVGPQLPPHTALLNPLLLGALGANRASPAAPMVQMMPPPPPTYMMPPVTVQTNNNPSPSPATATHRYTPQQVTSAVDSAHSRQQQAAQQQHLANQHALALQQQQQQAQIAAILRQQYAGQIAALAFAGGQIPGQQQMTADPTGGVQAVAAAQAQAAAARAGAATPLLLPPAPTPAPNPMEAMYQALFANFAAARTVAAATPNPTQR
ncbi:hypothetical protein DdX_11007 [Ditylenchus destructor]|uniref:Uncharacterized protein n=1 Tax=Ditylenchus destructor TaxID=166010 RepID=A0AAD4N3F7_9BILA|nr:hypothetical protein DdX_11007 [Ditylenchus destructor]